MSWYDKHRIWGKNGLNVLVVLTGMNLVCLGLVETKGGVCRGKWQLLQWEYGQGIGIDINEKMQLDWDGSLMILEVKTLALQLIWRVTIPEAQHKMALVRC